jgi:hypothetical protein
MRKTRPHLFEKFFLILILLWVALSFFDVSYNLVKSVSEAKFWLPLSESQKRHEIFGNIYDFINFVKNNSQEKSRILIFAKNDFAYFLGRYYLYPREIAVVSDLDKFKLAEKTKKYNYIAVFNKVIALDSYDLIASYSARDFVNWSIYKTK